MDFSLGERDTFLVILVRVECGNLGDGEEERIGSCVCTTFESDCGEGEVRKVLSFLADSLEASIRRVPPCALRQDRKSVSLLRDALLLADSLETSTAGTCLGPERGYTMNSKQTQ